MSVFVLLSLTRRWQRTIQELPFHVVLDWVMDMGACIRAAHEEEQRDGTEAAFAFKLCKVPLRCNPADPVQVPKQPQCPKVLEESAASDLVSLGQESQESLSHRAHPVCSHWGKQPKTGFRTVQETVLKLSLQRPESTFRALLKHILFLYQAASVATLAFSFCCRFTSGTNDDAKNGWNQDNNAYSASYCPVHLIDSRTYTCRDMRKHAHTYTHVSLCVYVCVQQLRV